MANLKLPPPNSPLTLQECVVGVLQRAFEYHQSQSNDNQIKLLLALSGGLDSCVLLHLLVQCQQILPFQLSALYVNHGISVNANKWGEFCQAICQTYQVPFQMAYVTIDKASGLGVEAAARNARYQALQSVSADWVCLAHHEDDQAETLLLQLARGAGVKGLAGMAEIDMKQKLLRPLLSQSKARLVTYAAKHQLSWVEDESNQSMAYDRNMMRHQVLPVLKQHYPAIHKTISRSATHLAEASDLLDELAKLDAQSVLCQQGQHHALVINQLANLNHARIKNLLRHWLTLEAHAHNIALEMPSAALLAQVIKQLMTSREDAMVKVNIGSGLLVRKYLNLAFVVNDYAKILPYQVRWQGEPHLTITNGLSLTFNQQLGRGLSLNKLATLNLSIRSRQGGERMTPELGRPSRTIKYLLQNYQIPPWQRERWPLVFLGDELIAIPNLVEAHFIKAKADEMGLFIQCHMD